MAPVRVSLSLSKAAPCRAAVAAGMLAVEVFAVAALVSISPSLM
jgi:hypothetical protein